MDMQNVSNLVIPEGEVKTIHDKDGRLLWGAVGYNTTYRGDTYQQTCSGANLYNVNDPAGVSAGASVDEDGWITLTVNNTGSSATYVNYYGKPMQLAADTEYAIVVELKYIKSNNLSNTSNYLRLTDSNSSQFNGTYNLPFTSTNPTQVGTHIGILRTKPDISGASRGLRTFLTVAPGVNQEVTFRISVLADTSVTPEAFVYEPYTNGTTAPNPDYPQNIQMVTGEQTVTVRGKNLFNINARSDSNSAAQTSTIGNSLTVTAVAASTAMYAIVIENSDDLLGKECTLSIGEASTSAESATTGRVAIYNGLLSNPTSVSGNIAYSTSVVSGSTLTFTFPNSYASGKDCFCILFYASSASSANTRIGDTSTYSDIQLEEGSTATAYEQYQSQPYEIDLTGKNLFDKNNLSDGWLDINNSINPDSSWKHTDYIPITPSTPYTTSGFANGSGTNPARCYYDANKVFISGVKHNNAAQFVNTSPSNARYMRECCRTTDIDTLQIEKGSTATPYAPYLPIELCKIGNYQDYIYKSGDDWYVHKEVQHLSLGISDMDNSEQYPGWRNTSVLVDTLGSGLNDRLNKITQYLANIISSDSSSADTGILSTNTRGTGSLFFQNGNWNQTYWKTNYPNLSLELYYGILILQADTQITDATLVGQLNAIHEWLTRYGYDSTVTGNLPIIINKTNL